MLRQEEPDLLSGAAANDVVNGPEEEETIGILDYVTDPEVAITLATDYLVPGIKALLIIFAAWIIAAWVRRVTRTGMERARIEPTINRFVSNVVRWAVLAVGLILVLSVFGVETATFAVVIGAMGLAIGLALQGTLGNAAAGLMLLIFRPFKVGDAVNAAGVSGKIVEIELFSTIIDTFDNRRLFVPNGSIFGATIENVNHHPTRRVDVQVGVSYDADIAQTRQVLKDAAHGIEEKIEEPAPAIVLNELADSSVNWTVRVWANTSDFWPVRDKLTERVKNALDEAGISIPFPQMDVHIKGRSDEVMRGRHEGTEG